MQPVMPDFSMEPEVVRKSVSYVNRKQLRSGRFLIARRVLIRTNDTCAAARPRLKLLVQASRLPPCHAVSDLCKCMCAHYFMQVFLCTFLRPAQGFGGRACGRCT
jgi:hypothetical protein